MAGVTHGTIRRMIESEINMLIIPILLIEFSANVGLDQVMHHLVFRMISSTRCCHFRGNDVQFLSVLFVSVAEFLIEEHLGVVKRVEFYVEQFVISPIFNDELG